MPKYVATHVCDNCMMKLNLFPQDNITVSLQPQVLIIDSDSANQTLASEFLLDYSPSSVDALSTDSPLGNIAVDVLFETNGVSSEHVSYNSQMLHWKWANIIYWLPENYYKLKMLFFFGIIMQAFPQTLLAT